MNDSDDDADDSIAASFHCFLVNDSLPAADCQTEVMPS